jgi:hypothetical protein
MTKKTAIAAINVLLAYAALHNRDQEFFNRGLNEFIFAGPSRKHGFIEQWQRALAATGETPIPSIHTTDRQDAQ